MFINLHFVVYFILVMSVLLLFYYYLTWNFKFWKKRSVSGPAPVLFWGNFKDCIMGKIHASLLTKFYYDNFNNDPVVGIFILRSPVLIVRDLNLIKDILIKDFSIFCDRGVHVNNNIEPLSQHFFNLPKSTWHPLRKKLSPAFTALKVKKMFGEIMGIADRFIRYVEEEIIKSDSIKVCELMGKFTTEVIGKCGFDLQLNEFSEEESDFQKLNKQRQKSNFYNFVRRLIRQFAPTVFYKYCKSLICRSSYVNFYVNIIKGVKSCRNENKFKKNDYVGLLLDLQKKPTYINVELTDKFLAAQAYVFFSSGSESTAVILSYAFYEIALNGAIQENLREEINKVFIGDENNLTYENIAKMQYLDKIFKETLRKYPLRDIIRINTQQYTFSDTDITIPKGTRIIIPHFAIHRDATIYTNPDIFDPERDTTNLNPMAYLPFGDGPRVCIGARFAEYVSKIVIISMVKNFKIEMCSSGYGRVENDPRKVLLVPKQEISLKLTKL